MPSFKSRPKTSLDYKHNSILIGGRCKYLQKNEPAPATPATSFESGKKTSKAYNKADEVKSALDLLKDFM